MNKIKFTTSTAKTYKIIEEILSYSKRDTSLAIWSNIFEIEEDKQLILDKLDELYMLIYKAKEEIRSLANPYNISGIKAINKIQQAIWWNNNLENSVRNIRREIKEDTINILKVCDSRLIEKGYTRKIIDNARQRELLESIKSLIEEFHDSNLPNDFKLELIRDLLKIQNALINFNITGEGYLNQVCNEVIGNIVTKASQKPKLFKQFGQSVQKVLNVTVFIGGLMTTYDLSVKYGLMLADEITNIIENLPDETDYNQQQLEAVYQPKTTYAVIDNGSNNKYLSSIEEE